MANALTARTEIGESGVVLRALGPVAITDGQQLVPLPRGRAASLLAWLVAHGDTGASVAASLAALWPYLDQTAASRELRRNLAVLRRKLAPVGATVIRRDGHVALTLPSQAAVDIDLFGTWLVAAEDASRRGAGRHALGLVRQALALWRGDHPFVEIRDTPAGAREAVRLDERRIDALDLRDGLRLQLDHDSWLLADLEAKVTAHPAHELGWRQLMVCLNEAGHGAGALRAFQACRQALGRLGLAPSDETGRVEAALLAGQAPEAELYMPRAEAMERHVAAGSRTGADGGALSTVDEPMAAWSGGSALETALDDAWAQPSRAYLAVLVGDERAAAEVADAARRRGAETVVITADAHRRPIGLHRLEVDGSGPLALIVERAEEAPADLLRAVAWLRSGSGPVLIALIATPGRLGPLSDLVLHADRVLELPMAT
jgi:DNA-binding SARP family transcriptional activator